MTDALRQISSAAASDPDQNAVARSSPDEELLDVLASPERRALLASLSTRESDGDDRISLTDLASAGEFGGAIELHHVHLPKLDDAGVLAYNSGERTVVPADGLGDGAYDELIDETFL